MKAEEIEAAMRHNNRSFSDPFYFPRKTRSSATAEVLSTAAQLYRTPCCKPAHEIWST